MNIHSQTRPGRVRMIRLDVNGETREVEAEPGGTVVEVLRDGLGLTGTKIVCGAGVCGACTVQLDGEPVVSCLLPVPAADGRRLTTVEGLTDHPVTRAFAAANALQCGFCTPGFVVEAAAFHDAWRATSSHPPGDAEIAAALAGHLCRCGAYPEIFAAVRAACAGTFDQPGPPIGPRVEAAAKVTGAAKYTVDVRHPGQLVGLLLRSPYAHARLRRLDPAPARGVPGVRAVIELAPADGVVRYVGQAVAAVAAVDRAAAEHGLAAVAVEWEPLPAVVDLAAARAPGAVEVYGHGKRQPPNAGEGAPAPARWRGNVRGPVGLFSTGRRAVARRLAAARRAGDPLLVESVYRTEAQLHTTFEPHAATARFVGDTLEVHLSTQAVAHVADRIADHFGLSKDRVRVIAEHVGGGFGAKLAMTDETVAAVGLARAAGAPVAVAFDRLEELSVAGYRPPAHIEVALLADGDARLRALRLAAYADSGVAVGSTIAGLARLIYPCDAKELLDYDVVTHQSPGTPFRGPGGPLTCFALEQAVDDAAARLGYDPIALRQRWDPEPGRQRLYRWAAARPTWRGRADLPRTGRFRRGVGVAVANWSYFWQAGCVVELAVESGRLVVATATQDMGTGSRTVLARTVAGVFGLDPAEVEVRLGDSRLPMGPMSGGSRTTATIVPAALAAADRLKRRLLVRGRRSSDVDWRAVLAGADGVRVSSPRPGDPRSVARRAAHGFAAAGATGTAFAALLRMTNKLHVGRGSTSALHVVEVEVDTRLARVRVLRVHAGLAVGRPISPELAAAQVHGSIIQGIGYALYERRESDPHDGRPLSVGLEDYRIPGPADVPEIDLHFDPDGFEHVAGGGVGLGEVATMPVAAAVANAVHDATGVRQRELPMTADRLLSAWTESGR
jgi:xanthine dehydrogenase YagR molybdenum-binding subunit